ncbi:hypothetical protein ACFOWY_06860 [Lysinibacter cavernae]
MKMVNFIFGITASLASIVALVVALQANAIAQDSAQRDKITQQFEPMSTTPDGTITSHTKYWTVITNEGRVPITVLEAHLVLDSAVIPYRCAVNPIHLMFHSNHSFVPLDGLLDEKPKSGGVLLAPGSSAALLISPKDAEGQLSHLREGCKDLGNELSPKLIFTLSNGNMVTADAAPHMSETPMIVRDAFKRLGWGFWPVEKDGKLNFWAVPPTPENADNWDFPDDPVDTRPEETK